MTNEVIISVNQDSLVEKAKHYLTWLHGASPKDLPEKQRDKYHTQLGMLVHFIEYVRNNNYSDYPSSIVQTEKSDDLKG